MKKQLLKDTISDVISEMCFLYEETEPRHWRDKYDYFAKVKGHFFDFYIGFDEEIAQLMTSNFLGEITDMDENDITETIKELVNMILGKFVGLCYPNYPSLLPIPQCKHATAEFPAFLPEDSLVYFYRKKPMRVVFISK